MTLDGQYEYYCNAQRNFNEAYKLVNDYVKDLYLLPKKLVENSAPAIDRYIREYSFADKARKSATPFEAVIDFIDQLDKFTGETEKLHNEHVLHARKSRVYLQKVEELGQHSTRKNVTDYVTDFVELTPELDELHKGLQHIKMQADEMIDRLEALELRWDSLRVKVSA